MFLRKIKIILQQGVSIVELIVGIAIIAILSAVAVPNLSTWIQNTQIRNASESIQSGLQLARMEAIRRNTLIRFQLTSSLNASCALSLTSANWLISYDDVTGLCNRPLFNDVFPASDAINNPAPRIIKTNSASEASKNAIVSSGQSNVTFDSMGRVTPVTPAGITINIKNPVGGACAPAGSMKCLRVVVSTGGQIRLCDPSLASTDPRSC
jgi:type IV fimbrial biogenesis protein FimT